MKQNLDLDELLFDVEGLSKDEITTLAFETGFCVRNGGKITPSDFVLNLCRHSIEGTVSYNDLAAKVEAKTGINASRQAYHQRMGDPCVKLFKKFLSGL